MKLLTVTADAKRRRSHSRGLATARFKPLNPHDAATVLIVDDDPSMLRSLKRLLVAAGFRVRTFDRPSALLSGSLPRSNACIVVDVNLPEMNGIEMCEVLKGTSRGLPTILITGRTDAGVRSLAAKSDAVAVLFKPFDEGPFLEAIERALSLST